MTRKARPPVGHRFTRSPDPNWSLRIREMGQRCSVCRMRSIRASAWEVSSSQRKLMKNPRNFVLTILSVSISLAAAGPAAAQTPGSLDPVFRPDVAGDYVTAIIVQPDG